MGLSNYFRISKVERCLKFREKNWSKCFYFESICWRLEWEAWIITFCLENSFSSVIPFSGGLSACQHQAAYTLHNQWCWVCFSVAFARWVSFLLGNFPGIIFIFIVIVILIRQRFYWRCVRQPILCLLF